MFDDLQQAGLIKRLDHVAIAVRDARAVVPLYRDILGAQFIYGDDEEEQGYRFIQFGWPAGSKIELLEPLREEGFLWRFLTTYGEGVHHITLAVNDLRAVVRALRERDYRVVDERYFNEHYAEAFISPRSANGTLIQLASYAYEELADKDKGDHIPRLDLAAYMGER